MFSNILDISVQFWIFYFNLEYFKQNSIREEAMGQ